MRQRGKTRSQLLGMNFFRGITVQSRPIRFGLLLLAILAPLLCCGEEKVPRLTGIVHWENTARALLELPSGRGVRLRPLLQIGEAAADFKVKRIEVDSGTVELLQKGATNHILTLGLPPAEQLTRRTLNLRAADLEQVLEVYQQLSGRTVIRSAAMPMTKIDCTSGADLSPELAVGTLTNSLRQAGTIITPIGAKFAVAGTERDDEQIKSLKQPPTTTRAPGEEIFPPGLIRFHEADSAQVLRVYAELTRRRVTPPQRTGPIKVTVRSQTPLNRREAVWLLEACFRMAGLPMWSEHTN